MAMLSFSEPTVYEKSKCFFTYGTMGHLDPAQLPKTWKGKPWTTILGQDFVHRVDLIIPERSWQAVNEKLVEGVSPPEFRRVTMTLGQILEGDFFTEYIKIGNIMMLSQGRRAIDDVFTLKDGQLTMFLEKETYERAGLVGKPYGAKGSRGPKPRWIVEFDLRSPSMFRGKKGFDRLVYACKNVLNEPLNWLFCNVYEKSEFPSYSFHGMGATDCRSIAPSPDPLDAFLPTKCTSKPEVAQDVDVTSPLLKPAADMVANEGSHDFEEFASDIYEWLSLVRLQSPRILTTDSMDTYLSRYQVPGEADQHKADKLCKISWEGFLSPTFARKALSDVILAVPSRTWLSLSVSTFSTGFYGDATECTFLRAPNSPGEYMMWEVKSHE